MKIAAYTCALNEQQFVNRWIDSVADADVVLVADTGSTDDTVGLLRSRGVDVRTVGIKPWRFDDAKNAALFMLPDDVDCAIQIDMDEILTEGWRGRLEAVWKPETNRLKYLYVWSWLAPGHPDRFFYADKISGRFSHRWRNPVHEILTPTVPEFCATCDSVVIEHYPDSSKSRGNYLDLLRQSIAEDPLNDRNAHYYARELWFYQRYDDAILQFQRHIELPTAQWAPERCASLRYMAKCYDQLNNSAKAYNYYMLAALEDATSREAYIDLAEFLLRQGEWFGVLYFATKASNIPVGHSSYINERYAREEGPYDLASVAFYKLGENRVALDYAKKALAFNPHDSRLQANLKAMEEAV